MKKSDKENPLAAALRLLYYRERSVAAMKDKLGDKGFSDDEITSVVEILIGDGLLNDRRFAAELSASRIRNKNWGPRKIALDLRRKGISAEITESVLTEITEETFTITATRALKKWVEQKGLDKGLDERNFARAYRHLESRGFARGLILKLIYPLREENIIE